MQYVRLHDLAAAVVAVVLLVGLLVLVGVGREIPQFLSHGFTAALFWAFRGGAQIANDLSHRDRGGSNDGPPTS